MTEDQRKGLLRQALVAQPQVDATAGDSALFVANVDSGCSGSCTDKKENLINLRPCREPDRLVPRPASEHMAFGPSTPNE